MAYTASYYHSKLLKKSGEQNYICRLTESKQKYKRHSDFWVGMYGKLWVITWEYLVEIVDIMMNFHPQKKLNYPRGIKSSVNVR